MHSSKSHFSRLFNRYNNRPTVHACTIAKAAFTEASFMGLSGIHECSGGQSKSRTGTRIFRVKAEQGPEQGTMHICSFAYT